MEEKFDKPEDMKQELNNLFETEANEKIAPLLKRVSLFLEDKDWIKADEYCERVLDQDPENATAYLGKLMVEMKVSKLEELADCAQSFENNGNYKKVKRFGDDEIGQLLDGYLETIKERAKDVQMVDASSNDLPEAESRPKPWEKLTKKENDPKGSIFKKKGFLIGLIAAVVVIIAAVIIIVSTTSPVDSKLVGLWLANDEVSGQFSAVKIERNGKCSGMTKSLFGDVMLFRGECSTKKGTMGIEVREITSSYVNEEEVLSNDTAIGFLLVEYEYKNPALYFTKVKDSGKGYFANYVLCPKYKTENKIFFKTSNQQDRKAFNEVISSWFERDTAEEHITENRQTENESYNPNVPVEHLPKEEDTTTKATESETITTDNTETPADTLTQEEVVLAWVCDYTQMTADQFYEAGGHIDYETNGTLYDYYNVTVPMAAATIVEITKTPPYTIDRTGSSYAFSGPGGWGYR